MPRSVALDPIVTQTALAVNPPPAKGASLPLDPICRYVEATQTVIVDVAR